MDTTFQFNAGKVIVKNRQFKYKYLGFMCIRIIVKILCLLFVHFGSALITKNVFAYCIEEYSLNTSINLGAIFSTFASSVISVVTLLSATQLNQYKENLNILQRKIIKISEWEHWPFIKRMRKQKIAPHKYQYQFLQNAEIRFQGFQHPTVFLIPTNYDDSKDLVNIFYYIKMIFSRNQYSYYLSTKPSHASDILVWDCLQTIYRNIICFKICQFICLIGGGFIINGILFAFFYHPYTNFIDGFYHFIKLF